MEYLQYKAANSHRTPDVRRMRAVLAQAGYMTSENDVEKLWDDYCERGYRGKWITPPEDDAELLGLLLIGFGVNPTPTDEDDGSFYRFPLHWGND